jgi:hypothetical protein
VTTVSKWAVWVALGLLAVAASCVATAQTARAQEPAEPLPVSIPALIVDAAERHGASAPLMLRIAWCESRFQPHALNRWDGSIGVFQWQWASFAEEARWLGLEGGSPWDVWANVEAAAFAIANGRAWRWRACL